MGVLLTRRSTKERQGEAVAIARTRHKPCKSCSSFTYDRCLIRRTPLLGNPHEDPPDKMFKTKWVRKWLSLKTRVSCPEPSVPPLFSCFCASPVFAQLPLLGASDHVMFLSRARSRILLLLDPRIGFPCA